MWDGARGEWIPTNVAKIEEPKKENPPTGKFMKLLKKFDSSPTAGAVALMCFGFLLLVFSEIYEYSASCASILMKEVLKLLNKMIMILTKMDFSMKQKWLHNDSAVDAYQDELRISK